jgi:hypothetical protein
MSEPEPRTCGAARKTDAVASARAADLFEEGVDPRPPGRREQDGHQEVLPEVRHEAESPTGRVVGIAVMEDFVADLPDVVAELKGVSGRLPSDVALEPETACAWKDRRFVHVRVTLPLLDHEGGVGFGLWVELDAADYSRFLAACEDDARYLAFTAPGKLANEWPGFEGMRGVRVRIRAVRVDEKPHVTEVLLDAGRDPAFEASLRLAPNDQAGKKRLREMVRVWMQER